MTSAKPTPPHHVRYARAWYLYQDTKLSHESKVALENEMDSAQSLFAWDEFQAFKKTLEGFQEHWDVLRSDMLGLVAAAAAKASAGADKALLVVEVPTS